MTENKKISEYSIEELREVCQYPHRVPKKKKEESLMGQFSLKFSIYLTKLLLYTKITPNQITTLSVIVFFAGLSLFLFNEPALNILGLFIVLFSMLLDGSDGDVARFRKVNGRLGGVYVEPVSHDIQYGFAFLFISLGLVTHGYPPYFYILGGIAGLTKISTRLLQARYCDLLRNNAFIEDAKKINRTIIEKSMIVRGLYFANKNFFSSTGVFSMLFIFTIINRIDLYLWFFGVGYTLLWIAMLSKQTYQINKENLK